VSLKGLDVIDYLQRLTTVNLKFMKTGEGRPGFLLTPQAKIKSYFYLWIIQKEPAQESEVWLEFDAGTQDKWKSELISLLEQFQFAEKFTMTEITELQSLWLFAEPESVLQSVPEAVQSSEQNNTPHSSIDPSGARLLHHGSTEFGRPWISAWGTPEQITQLQKSNPTSIEIETLSQWRIAAGQPWVDSEITENSNPLEIGLHHAVAGNKGCYPGQEVIEKIISLGAPARRLVKLSGEGSKPEVGAVVNAVDPGKTEAGRITSATQTESGGFEALALIKKIYAQEGAQFAVGSEKTATIVQVSPYLGHS
jgi:folate-binding protein YgfZ